MSKKKLGNRHVCYQCGCKFYDLNRPRPICPKCGADQTEAPKREPVSSARTRAVAPAPHRTRSRRVRQQDEILEPDLSFSEDEIETPEPLENGLSMINDDELIGPGPEDFTEED